MSSHYLNSVIESVSGNSSFLLRWVFYLGIVVFASMLLFDAGDCYKPVFIIHGILSQNSTMVNFSEIIKRVIFFYVFRECCASNVRFRELASFIRSADKRCGRRLMCRMYVHVVFVIYIKGGLTSTTRISNTRPWFY